MITKVTLKTVCALLLAVSAAVSAGDRYYIDVRSDEEFNAGHVSVAAHVPHDEIAARIGEVTEDRDAEIFLYCKSGRRAGIAKDVLEDMGYTRVTNLNSLEAARIHASKHTDSSVIFD
jgi:phage shock protein E